MTRTCFFVVFLVSLAFGGQITNVTSLDEVQDSGDNYPQSLPFVSNPSVFASKTVLFVFDHGVEDHEMYYIHQYFKSRGATIRYGCVAGRTEVVLSDFFKPSYTVKCNVNVDDANIGSILDKFDAIYIPGGVPSSSAVRGSARFMAAIKPWVSRSPGKLFAVICSGTETLIDSGLLEWFPTIVGSPASYIPLEVGYQALFMPASGYKGFDSNYNAISYPSDGKRANIVIGKNPDASPYFVVEIGKTWGKLNETVPSPGQGVPLNLRNGKYIDPDFTIVTSLEQLPNIDEPIPHISPKGEFPPATIGVAISSGAHAQEVVMINSFFTKAGASVVFICPSWVPPYKQGKVFLHTDPPARPTHVAQCDHGFNDVLSGKIGFDVLIVPGGLFSTGGVLRNDRELVRILNDFPSRNSGALIFVGTGSQLLIPSRLSMGSTIIAAPLVARDLSDAGYHLTTGQNICPEDGSICVVTNLAAFLQDPQIKR